MESRNEKLLRLWKARQEADGVDVSAVKTLEEAEHFYDKRPEEGTAAAPAESEDNEVPNAPEVPDAPEVPEVDAQDT